MSSEIKDLPYWVGFASCPKLGPKGFALLRKAFPDMSAAWQAKEKEYKRAGLDDGLIKALAEHKSKTDITAGWEEVLKLKLDVTPITADDYPKLLKEIYDPPPLLFSKGNKQILDSLCLAVVGSRQASLYGLAMTREIVSPLAQAGVTIVSGLAYGIDAAAHRHTIDTGGNTVAVMASGLDQIYPTANRKLAYDILDNNGLWLSEFSPHTTPLKQNFPFRNRIIAGLTSGTIVIEAAKSSGALLTAKHALESNREIFALPGNAMSPTAEGTNDLLKQGAHLVTKAQDVLDVFGLKTELNKPREPLSAELQSVLELLPYEPNHLETLVRELKLPAARLIAHLTILEIKGYIKDEGGQFYRRLK